MILYAMAISSLLYSTPVDLISDIPRPPSKLSGFDHFSIFQVPKPE